LKYLLVSLLFLASCVTIEATIAGRDAKSAGAQDVGHVGSNQATLKADVPVSLVPK